ncbi:MAG TPA: ABC transporter ATP-binding protein [Aliiroseovarius sp.]|nr:ABC transporter ATP-binding protein [Aliiroseovarius sp.]
MFRLFENLIDPFAPDDGTTPPATLWAYLKTQLAPFRRWLPWLGLTGILVAVMETGLIFYSGRLIDLMGSAGPGAFWPAHGLELALAAAFVLMLRPLVITLNHLFLEQMLAGNMQEQVRFRAHRHLLRQSVSFFQNDFAGRLANRVMQLGGAVEDSIYMVFEALFYAVTYVVAATVLLARLDMRLALPLVLWVAVYASYTLWIARRVASASEKWSDARSRVTGRVVDAYANIETVKLFATATEEEAWVLSAMRRQRLRWQRFLRLMTEQTLVLTLINGFLIVGMIAPALWLWNAGQVSVGQVAAASALVLRLNGMSGWIMWITVKLFENAGVIREGLRSISVEPELTDRPGAPALALTRGEIAFDDVSHHYGRGTGGLDHLSLTVPAGQKLGLVGRSGAGKSSLVNLLLRFRDPEQGRILIDGQDISTVTQDSLRAAIGVVTQDSSLLHRSVRANVLYGSRDASEEALARAARRAEAHDFIATLQDPSGRTGFTAQVGERGVKLSGGQRQRIAIARVILKDAPILVLDEATSALDSEVEGQIQRTLYAMMEGKTVIAIAHRLSTLARMDWIVVLDQGRIVEDGTHDALLAAGGLYSELWAHQSGGFLGDVGEKAGARTGAVQ